MQLIECVIIRNYHNLCFFNVWGNMINLGFNLSCSYLAWELEECLMKTDSKSVWEKHIFGVFFSGVISTKFQTADLPKIEKKSNV